MMTRNFFCNACNAEFEDEAGQKLHYRSEWHQYNLRRKVAGVPGVTESLFKLRLEALAEEKKKIEKENLLFKCSICNKEYRSSKAHAQHLRSKLHTERVALVPDSSTAQITVTRPIPNRSSQSDEAPRSFGKRESQDDINQSDSDEWEEVDASEVVDMAEMSDEEVDEWDSSQCFFCDLKPDGSIEGCLEHTHKVHGFFIPDSQYLINLRGLLNYLALKVTNGFMCLYCNEQGKHFQSLEAVRKHMVSKSHCKLRYEDGDDGLDEELEEFYDFNINFEPENDTEMSLASDVLVAPVSLGIGGSELMVRQTSGSKTVTKVLGSREFGQYYKQRPRPTEDREGVLINAVIARYRNMGLTTKSSRPLFRRTKDAKQLPEIQKEAMRSKLGMKNNVINNLPKNVPY